MPLIVRSSAGALALCVLLVQTASAADACVVGDPQIKTDHTYYQGELACSTLPRLVASALNTPGRPSSGELNKDKILKLWYWRIEHFFHAQSPAEYNLPGVTPNPPSDSPLMIVRDCLTSQFSYAHGLCGTNHAMMTPIMDAAGFNSRCRGIVGDTSFEAFVNGRWVMVNTDSASILSMSNSTSAEFAGIDDLIANRSLMSWNPLGIPQYPFGSQQTGPQGTHSADWYYYYSTGFNTTPAACDKLYARGYQARPIVYALKRSEKFTRFNDRDGLPHHLGDSGGYRFWGYSGAGGVVRDWSYVGKAPALNVPPTSNAIANSRYGNGLFEWNPDLAAGEILDGAVSRDANVVYGSSSPRLKTSSGIGQITLSFFSPYVIAAKPGGGADPALAGASGGAWITAGTTALIPVEISINNGASWISAGALNASLDFTDLVKGRHAYLLRLTLSSSAGLNSFSLKNAVQVSQGVFPRLKDDGAQVTYQAGATNVVDASPDYSSQTLANVTRVADSGNLSFTPLSSTNTMAYRSTNNQPCFITYRVTAPNAAKLVRVHAAADFQVRVPPSGNPYGIIAVSTNNGASFTQVKRYDVPSDNVQSDAWFYATADVSSANISEALVKITFYNGGYTAGLRHVRLFGEYSTGATAALQITHTWNDSTGTGKTFVWNVPAGASAASYTVPTASATVHKKVVFETLPAAPVYALTVLSGTGSGSYAAGTTATIGASAAPSGKVFDRWIGSGVSFSNASSASTTLSMPAAAVSVIATYKDNALPVIKSLSAAPNPALAGQTVQFAVAAADLDGHSLTCTWDFGDAATGSGSATAHTYSAAGTYSVILSVSDGFSGLSTQTLQLVVNMLDNGGGGTDNGGGGTSPPDQIADDDGDGVTNQQELLDGTDPRDPGSAQKLPISVLKLQGAVSFSSTGRDNVSISGSVPGMAAGFAPKGASVVLYTGGASAEYLLDAKGKGLLREGTLQLKIKLLRDKTTRLSRFPGGDVPFKARLRGTLAPLWADEGVDPGADKLNQPLSLVVNLKINGVLYGTLASARYSSKANKGGKFKKQ